MVTLYTTMNLLLVAFEDVIAFYLTNSFFERKRKKCSGVVTVLILVFVNFAGLILFNQWQIIKTLFSLFLIALWIFTFYQASFLQGIVVSTILLSYWTLMDIICLSIFGISGMDISAALSDPNAYYFVCLSAKVLELLGIVLFHAIAKGRLHIQNDCWTDWLRILFFPSATLVISVYITYIFMLVPSLAPQLLGCNVILLLSDVMSFLLLDYMEKQQCALRDNAILQQNLKSERESVEVWINAYKEQRKQSHDFQNQLSVLRGMLENDAPKDTFLQYINSISTCELPTSLCVDTHRPVVDALLGQKSAVAKSKDIEFQLQLDYLHDFPLPDDALVVVLSNLIDNAIEAVERISEKDRRYILLKMQVFPEASYLYIENPTDYPVEIQKNKVATTKSKHLSHGFGLQNVETVLMQNDVTFALDYQPTSQLFCFSAEIGPND